MRHWLRVLWRRKWIILLATLVVPGGALAYSFHQRPVYEASAHVLINAQNTAVQDIAGVAAPQDPQRFLDTQAALAREPQLVQEVLANGDAGALTVDGFLSASSVSEHPNTNLLVFRVRNHRPNVAARLAAEYAEQYVLFERKVDTSALITALANVRARIAKIQNRDSPLYADLSDKEQQLETTLTLLTSTATVVRTPDSADKVAPRPLRNGGLGLVLGLILGVGLAFLREALDTRIRNADVIQSQTGLPLLGRIPEPSRRFRTRNRLVMLAEPFSPQAEAFRSLRTNIEFANLKAGARVIMVTSAVEREGKSTTAANLAVAFARAGERVILVDLDLRRPALHRFFDHESRPGITDVVLGQVEVADALFDVPIGETREGRLMRTRRIANGRLSTASPAALGVLPAGLLPPNPGEFVRSQALAQTLVDLRRHADLVIVDSPPLLHVSDALTLSSAVDALIVVTRLDAARRNTLAELSRVIATSRAVPLDFVLTGAERDEGYDFDYTTYHGRQWNHDGVGTASSSESDEEAHEIRDSETSSH